MPTHFHKSRILLLFVVAILAFLVVALRLFHLQIYQYEKWTKEKEKIQKKTILTRVKRGTIYDRNGNRLAANIEVNSLYARPKNIAEEEKPLMAKNLASILGLDQNKVLAKLSNNGFAWIKRKLSDKEVELIKGWIIKETGEEDFKKNLLERGLGLIKEERRIYPYNSLAAHLIGFVDIDNRGLESIELSYDKDLAGKPVEVTLIKDGKGNTILSEDNIAPPLRGYDLILTIDKVIQSIAEKELAATCDKSKAKSGIIIVANPQNGEILALANYPTYDLNNFFRYEKGDERKRNRALTDPFEPGSTFKIITAASVLEEGKVNLEDKIFVPERFRVANHTFTRERDESSLLTFREVIEKSSNIGTIKTAERLSQEDFYRYVSSFGFGKKTGINLPGENRGKLHQVEGWSGTSKACLAIGQGISVTGLQMINAAMAVANGGKLIKPYIVKTVINPNGKTVRNYEPKTMGQIISYETSRKLASILEGVVKNGTGKKAGISNLRICGKTGTAQKVDPETKEYSKTDYVASFVGYFPADNPKIAILVTIDEPKPVYWGGEIAAPCFKKVAWRTASYLNLLPIQNNPQIALGEQSDVSSQVSSKD